MADTATDTRPCCEPEEIGDPAPRGVVLHVELSERALAELLEAHFGPARERAAITMRVMQMVVDRASPYLDALWEDYKESRERMKEAVTRARAAAAKDEAAAG